MSRRRKVLQLAVLVVLAGVSAFVLAPSPIDPVAWEPPPSPPLEGVLAPNEALKAAEHRGVGVLTGPETVVVDPEGRAYAGCADGRIWRESKPGGPFEVYAETRGRPLGLDFAPDGTLYVADADRGLLAVAPPRPRAPSGEVSVLAHEADGVRFGFTDDVKVGPDGHVYFTDATSQYGVRDYNLDLADGRPHGRLLKYNPEKKETIVLLRDLFFPNGVAVSLAGDFVLVNETWRYRITRYWLAGSRAGQSEIFADALPGFPDGLSRGDDGLFYLALFTVRDAAADFTARRPWTRSLLAKLPMSMWPKPRRYGFVVALDDQGRLVQSWQDPSGEHMWEVTAARRVGESLYLGSLHNDRIGVLKL